MTRKLINRAIAVLAGLLMFAVVFASPALASSVTITSSSYDQQSVSGAIASVIKLGGGDADNGKPTVAFEHTNVMHSSKRQVLKRCVSITKLSQLKKAMKTKKFKHYRLICFEHGIKLVENWQGDNGDTTVQMPVFGDFRVGLYNPHTHKFTAQGTWFGSQRLHSPTVQSALLSHGYTEADIIQAIAAGGGWFFDCGNGILFVKTFQYTWDQVNIVKVRAKGQYQIVQNLTGNGIANATGSCPDGTTASASSAFYGHAQNVVELSFYTLVEAQTYATQLNQQPVSDALKLKTKADADSNLSGWATASVKLDCNGQPPVQQHYVNLGCTTPEEYTVGEPGKLDCDVTSDDPTVTITLSVTTDGNLRASGTYCYTTGKSTCVSGQTYETTLTGLHEGSTTYTVVAYANGVQSSTFTGSGPVDSDQGGF